MQLPQPLIQLLQGITGFDEKAFIALHQSGEQVTSVRLNPAKVSGITKLAFDEIVDSVPWCSNGYYLSQRPSFTFDPLFHAGCYYVQ